MKKNKLPKNILSNVIHKKYSEVCPSCGQIENTHAKGCYFCPKGREQHLGIPPGEIVELDDRIISSPIRADFTVHKSSKSGEKSFRITKSLLDSLIETSMKIQKQPKLILEIANEYIVTCSITKK